MHDECQNRMDLCWRLDSLPARAHSLDCRTPNQPTLYQSNETKYTKQALGFRGTSVARTAVAALRNLMRLSWLSIGPNQSSHWGRKQRQTASIAFPWTPGKTQISSA